MGQTPCDCDVIRDRYKGEVGYTSYHGEYGATVAREFFQVYRFSSAGLIACRGLLFSCYLAVEGSQLQRREASLTYLNCYWYLHQACVQEV